MQAQSTETMKCKLQGDFFFASLPQMIITGISDCELESSASKYLLSVNDRAAVDAILSITYGITPTNFEHPFIKTPEQVNEIFADVARGGYLGNYYHLLVAVSSPPLHSRCFPVSQVFA